MHPLARDFLLTEFRRRDDSNKVGKRIFSQLLCDNLYDDAFEVIDALSLFSCVEDLITRAYSSLILTGRLATLERFRRYALIHGVVLSSILDLISAEVAVREGDSVRARAVATAAASSLPSDHPLKGAPILLPPVPPTTRTEAQKLSLRLSRCGVMRRARMIFARQRG